MQMRATHPTLYVTQSKARSRKCSQPYSKTPRFAIPNHVYCTPLPDNRILQNHTPLRPTVILRPPYLLSLATAAH